jgi:hypothetical protein
VGQRFSAHFITSIAARVKARDFMAGHQGGQELLPMVRVAARRVAKHEDCVEKFEQLELGACYVAGTAMTDQGEPDFKKQYHVQLTALYDEVGESLRMVILLAPRAGIT